jgi:hypothetical protein
MVGVYLAIFGGSIIAYNIAQGIINRYHDKKKSTLNSIRQGLEEVNKMMEGNGPENKLEKWSRD